MTNKEVSVKSYSRSRERFWAKAEMGGLGLVMSLVFAACLTTPALAQHSPSTVFQTTLNRLTTFVVGNNGHLYDKYYNNGWIWEDQGTPPGALAIDSPGAVYQTPLDRIVAFVMGDNGHLYDKYYN